MRLKDKVYKVKYSSGNVEYYNIKGQLHRTDGPAIIYQNGTEEWYQNNKLHNENGPAITHPDGHKCWYINGKKHRTDGPAIIFSDEYEMWYKNGIFDVNKTYIVNKSFGYDDWNYNRILINKPNRVYGSYLQ